MTDEQINQRIAEACGWECLAPDVWHNGIVGYSKDTHGIVRSRIPDYCNDLNAIHEAEKVLNKEQIADYFYFVWPNDCEWRWAILATARQRAEAFLRTLGKWEEVQG